MAGVVWGIVILLVIVWVLVKVVFGIAGALFHLLLVGAVVLAVLWLVRAAASRRI